MTPFLNKTIVSRSVCSLRSCFQRAIYDASKFFLVLALFGVFKMTAHVKSWLILPPRYFDDSELLVRLLCSFHLTSHFLSSHLHLYFMNYISRIPVRYMFCYFFCFFISYYNFYFYWNWRGYVFFSIFSKKSKLSFNFFY